MNCAVGCGLVRVRAASIILYKYGADTHCSLQTSSCSAARLVWTARSHSSSRMRLRLRKGPHPAVTEHHARLLQDAHPSRVLPIGSLDESCRLMHRQPRQHQCREFDGGFAFKRSQSRSRTANLHLTSYKGTPGVFSVAALHAFAHSRFARVRHL